MASAGLNEESVEKRLMSINNTQDSIQGLSLWIIHHKTHHVRIVELWYKVMKRTVKPSHRLTLFYLCNDVVQTCKRKKANVYIDTFKPLLRQVTPLVRDVTIKPKIERIFNIWEERQVFDKDFVSDLKAILDGKPVDSVIFKKPHTRREKGKDKGKGKLKPQKVEKVSDDFDNVQPADATLEPPKEKEKPPEEEAPSEETLAAFKPADMIEKIRTFKHQEAEVDIKVRQLSHLKLDASSIEAVKQLKDRAHGNEFSTQFEESCLRLEDAVRGLEKKNGEQRDLMDQLKISEFFYDQQFREARIVVNAYKNYGARINVMKRKVEELVRSLPSPTPSPSSLLDALSPSSTPPDPSLDQDEQDLSLDPTNGQALLQQGEVMAYGRVANTTITHSILQPIPSIKEFSFADEDIPSPPDEAPSPAGSSPGDSPLQIKGSSSLENRLASFIPSLQAGSGSGVGVRVGEQEEPHHIPVYVPQPLTSNGNPTTRRPSANKTLTEPELPFPVEDEEDQEGLGGSTPLTDEQPSTPVMDEDPPEVASPSPPPPPPPSHPPEKKKKENPIDFLSRLISQTQKSKPTGGGTTSSFLESFALLSNKVKDATSEKVKGHQEDSGGGGDSPGPKSWKAWKAEKAVEEGTERAEPAPAAMAVLPPPPIPTFAMPPPPPPVSLGLAPPMMPLPVPPPSSSFYQHTSPGQKENWPEVGGEGLGVGSSGAESLPSPNVVYPPVQGEVSSPSFSSGGGGPGGKPKTPIKGILRKSSHSVLKELTPSIEDSALPPTSDMLQPPPPPPPPMDSSLGEGSAISTLGSGSGSGSSSEAQEFMEKLKRKTSLSPGSGPAPSPAYTPNPIRPNLMTLTPGGEMDMDIDDDEEEEEEEEEDDERTRIPVLSSVVRRVGPEEQKQAREKEMMQLRERDGGGKRKLESAPAPISSTVSLLLPGAGRDEPFHKERRYSHGRDGGGHDSTSSYYPSTSPTSAAPPPPFGYRDARSFSYGGEGPNPYFQPYSQNQNSFYSPDNGGSGRGFNSYDYRQFGPKQPFHKHDFPHRGRGNRRSFHY